MIEVLVGIMALERSSAASRGQRTRWCSREEPERVAGSSDRVVSKSLLKARVGQACQTGMRDDIEAIRDREKPRAKEKQQGVDHFKARIEARGQAGAQVWPVSQRRAEVRRTLGLSRI